MKKTSMIMAIGASMLLGACSDTKPEKDDTPVVVDQCTWPDAPAAVAPEWVCSGSMEGVELAGVGSHKSKVPSLARQKAQLDARVDLAQRMKVHVENLTKAYLETTGSGDEETVDQAVTSTSKQITDQTLVGVKTLRTRVSPNGTTYVIVGLNPEDVERVTETALRTSMNNERAAWQQFRAQKGYDELAKEIAAFRQQQGQ